jgi:uncharacterized membrane protein (UPF0127 family)
MRVRAAGLMALSLALLVGITACQAEPKVTIYTKQDRQVSFLVEVADTPAKREMGLQYRRELADDRGMIFIFPVESQQSFWMKNTPIALDMIFINRDRRIVGIVEQTTPFSLDPRFVSAQSQFVLEIRGGLAKRFGIQSGDTVSFEGISEGVKE